MKTRKPWQGNKSYKENQMEILELNNRITKETFSGWTQQQKGEVREYIDTER